MKRDNCKNKLYHEFIIEAHSFSKDAHILLRKQDLSRTKHNAIVLVNEYLTLDNVTYINIGMVDGKKIWTYLNNKDFCFEIEINMILKCDISFGIRSGLVASLIMTNPISFNIQSNTEKSVCLINCVDLDVLRDTIKHTTVLTLYYDNKCKVPNMNSCLNEGNLRSLTIITANSASEFSSIRSFLLSQVKLSNFHLESIEDTYTLLPHNTNVSSLILRDNFADIFSEMPNVVKICIPMVFGQGESIQKLKTVTDLELHIHDSIPEIATNILKLKQLKLLRLSGNTYEEAKVLIANLSLDYCSMDVNSTLDLDMISLLSRTLIRNLELTNVTLDETTMSRLIEIKNKELITLTVNKIRITNKNRMLFFV